MNATLDLDWEPPRLQPHRLGGLNKFGARAARSEPTTHFEGADLDALVKQYGSPLFVTSERRLRANARRLKRAFLRHHGKVVHGWSYKTNYLSAVCQILHQEGAWAEVVSEFEYSKARRLGVPGNHILFNGPGKSRTALERAVAEGAHIHVDNFDELRALESVARELGCVPDVTLRLNFDTGYLDAWSRFGFNLENGEAHEAAALIKNSLWMRLTGLHSHLGTFILEPRAYGEQVRIMCAFAEELESDGKVEIQSLDIGGGLPSHNALQGVYLHPNQAVPELDAYAEAVGRALKSGLAYRDGRPTPTLFLESGRAVVDDAQILLTSVVGTRRLPDGRRAAVMDAGVNLLFTSFWYNHHVASVRPLQGPSAETVLYGPLCMNIDVLRQSVDLPPLRVGDTLAVSSVGAYNNTQWMQFITYRPPVLLVHEDGEVSVIREGENLDTMCSLDRLPAHLR